VKCPMDLLSTAVVKQLLLDPVSEEYHKGGETGVREDVRKDELMKGRTGCNRPVLGYAALQRSS
jgi:hypothetical protein